MNVSEIESADDFTLVQATRITQVTFTGLLTGGATLASIGQIRIEIYRVFPFDSVVPPSGNVPTRANSPSDIAFADRGSLNGELTFATALLAPSFTVLNSVTPGGIHPSPTQTTGGNGAQTGAEVLFTVDLIVPFVLPIDHYFFIPQVQVTGGNFLWLSAAKPNGPPDLQSWTRDAALDPDWLRIGTDIVGGSPAPNFNASFSLIGQTIPEPATLALLGAGLFGVGWKRRRAAAR